MGYRLYYTRKTELVPSIEAGFFTPDPAGSVGGFVGIAVGESRRWKGRRPAPRTRECGGNNCRAPRDPVTVR